MHWAAANTNFLGLTLLPSFCLHDLALPQSEVQESRLKVINPSGNEGLRVLTIDLMI
jgi:hypothetical protein